jgi:hypothetical protein
VVKKCQRATPASTRTPQQFDIPVAFPSHIAAARVGEQSWKSNSKMGFGCGFTARAKNSCQAAASKLAAFANVADRQNEGWRDKANYHIVLAVGLDALPP